MNEFTKTFQKLSRTHDPSVIFNDFLDYFIDQFLINPSPEDKLFHYKQYTEEEYALFYKLIENLIHYSEKIFKEYDWYDILGHFYEELVQSKMKSKGLGQFYTPTSVTKILSELTYTDEDSVQYCYDPACGSSRTLLAHHSKRPYDVCIGYDLDSTSVKMSVVNFVLHGVKGAVVHMDTLENRFFDGFKVNEFVDFGLPCGVMRCSGLDECLVFIGVGNKSKKIMMDESPALVRSGQTTLI